jgi:hypothetical protein
MQVMDCWRLADDNLICMFIATYKFITIFTYSSLFGGGGTLLQCSLYSIWLSYMDNKYFKGLFVLLCNLLCYGLHFRIFVYSSHFLCPSNCSLPVHHM